METSYRLIHRVVPYPREDVIGFLSRAAERNHLWGPATLLETLAGTSHTTVGVNDLPRLAYLCLNHLQELLPLSGIERRGVGGERTWQIQGEWVTKGSFLSARHVKLCPHCLAEAPYLRGVWSLSFYIACAHHKVNLIDRCPGCRRALKWDRRYVTHCNCGYDLTQAPTKAAAPTATLVAQLLALRSEEGLTLEPGVLPLRELERLAGLSLDGLCKTVWFLGHCLAELGHYGAGHGLMRPRAQSAAAIIENALMLLSVWPHSLGDMLGRLARRLPPDSPIDLVDKLMRPVNNYLHEDLQTDELAFLGRAYEQHLQLLWRSFGRLPWRKDSERQLRLELH